jgi:LysR family transcriptional regulator, mexEF-oprN operon transcriptional activator
MRVMHESYARDLDLNLLRVFAVVAEARTVTEGAAQLYLTQPAVSSALRRLQTAVGVPLFQRRGRGLVLTARGRELLAGTRKHLPALLQAALSPTEFNAQTNDRAFRLGVSDASAGWLLAPLVRSLETLAPRMRIIAIPVQFRTIAHALGSGQIDLAVTVADELPADITRELLFRSQFVCLFDGQLRGRAKLTRKGYFQSDHVIVSYNGDLRGVVEDATPFQRRVRCSVPSFESVGALLAGSKLLATVPQLVAAQLLHTWPQLRQAPLPFALPRGRLELLWPTAQSDDPALSFLLGQVRELASTQARALKLS